MTVRSVRADREKQRDERHGSGGKDAGRSSQVADESQAEASDAPAES
jgi:hypothetical protein